MSQLFLQYKRLLVCAISLIMLQAHAQDQSGFISIDCGQQNGPYMDAVTKMKYIPDTDFVDTGESKVVSSLPNPPQKYEFVRIFPAEIRNCYKIINIKSGQKYLIRANFVYGNYDKETFFPRFELHLGASFWDTVVISRTNAVTTKELIHIPMRNYIHVCLVNIDKGVPFISTIELRPVRNDIYQTENGSLALIKRANMAADNITYRFPQDILDRIWYPTIFTKAWKELNTSFDIDRTAYELPYPVMRTALTPKDISKKYLKFPMEWLDKKHVGEASYSIYLHFAEVEKSSASLSRNLTISIKDEKPIGIPFDPQYLIATTINVTVNQPRKILLIYSPGRPILNAYEIYMVKHFLVSSETNEQDVEAITKIKSTYKIIRNWQGDPCNPKEYIWKGVSCSYPDNDSPRIISLNLSYSGLTKEVPDVIANLTMIQTLDLSNNKLSGNIPEYLSELPKLTILNLEKNELSGSVPAGLIAKRNLSLSMCGNPSLSRPLPCEKKKEKKNQFVIPVVVFIVVMLWISSIAAVLVWKSKTFNAVWKQYCRLGACTESVIEENRREHDVFLSFRGEDTRTGFARYLHDALDKKGIKTFFDDQNLQIGDEIGPTLLNAIEVSEISIILFSENYVTSSWCLGELVNILECKKKMDQRIVPVFYKVNPSDIRHQSGSFSLQKWIDKRDAKVPVWKEALREVANLSGYHYKDGYEIETIDKIVKFISDITELKKKNSLHRFDTICPPDGGKEIVIYMTSSTRDMNFQNCQSILQTLSQFDLMKVQQRDVTIRKFRKELKKLMKKELPPPRLFVHGKYVGGYDEVSKLIRDEPWFCETLDKFQRRYEVSFHSRNLVQQEEARSVGVSETETGGRSGSPA